MSQRLPKNLSNNDQHGFRQGRSCLRQLLAHIDNLTNKVIEEGNAGITDNSMYMCVNENNKDFILNFLKSDLITFLLRVTNYNFGSLLLFFNITLLFCYILLFKAVVTISVSMNM